MSKAKTHEELEKILDEVEEVLNDIREAFKP